MKNSSLKFKRHISMTICNCLTHQNKQNEITNGDMNPSWLQYNVQEIDILGTTHCNNVFSFTFSSDEYPIIYTSTLENIQNQTF
jgi:hypothetical protein